MNKIIFTIALLLVCWCDAMGQQREGVSYAIGFYNVENLFDTCHDAGKNDYDFLPEGSYGWTAEKYESKLKNIAHVISEMGTDRMPRSLGCAIVGVSEVENSKVLDELVGQRQLKVRGYEYCHVEGPDDRGIDCALIYNPSLFTVDCVQLVPYVQPLEKDSAFHTRGFLTVRGKLGGTPLAVIVNHLPSRRSTSFYREQGARQIKAVKDSLLRIYPDMGIIVMGDMNDDPMDASMAECLQGKRCKDGLDGGDMYNPWWDTLSEGNGTLCYRGRWNLFDQILLSPSLVGESGNSQLKYYDHQIFSRDYLFQTEGKYAGYPKRTHAGGVWLDGYSDHLPTVVYLVRSEE